MKMQIFCQIVGLTGSLPKGIRMKEERKIEIVQKKGRGSRGSGIILRKRWKGIRGGGGTG